MRNACLDFESQNVRTKGEIEEVHFPDSPLSTSAGNTPTMSTINAVHQKQELIRICAWHVRLREDNK